MNSNGKKQKKSTLDRKNVTFSWVDFCGNLRYSIDEQKFESL